MSREEAEVLVLREVDTATLRWPDDTDLDDYGSSSNRLYRDMRAFSWDDAANALDLEETLLGRVGAHPRRGVPGAAVRRRQRCDGATAPARV